MWLGYENTPLGQDRLKGHWISKLALF